MVACPNGGQAAEDLRLPLCPKAANSGVEEDPRSLTPAEGEGFEPSRDETAPNGFRDRPVQPLRHPSRAGKGQPSPRLASEREEAPEEVGRLARQKASGHLRAVVEPRLAEHVDDAACRPRPRVAGA